MEGNKMYLKVEISGIITVKTGMHIGGSDSFSAIGAIDKPVIRDAVTMLPMIPGSTLKGKMRYLLSRKYNKGKFTNSHNNDPSCVKRLFGSSEKDENGVIHKSRLLFNDSVLENNEDLLEMNIPLATEVKAENNIDRLTAKANPRQIERVIAGARFPLYIIYELTDANEAEEDFKLVKEGLELLQYDYIGGHGSRGYGRIEISELDCYVVIGEAGTNIEESLRKALGVEQ